MMANYSYYVMGSLLTLLYYRCHGGAARGRGKCTVFFTS